MIHVTVRERDAAAQATEPITTGSVGLTVRFRFSEDWTGLARCAVFQGSGQSVDMALEDGTCAVPHEVLQSAGGHLKIGVYGTGDDGQRVTPTVWADAGPIREGAEPAEVESTPATATLIQRLLEAAEAVKNLDDTLSVGGAAADAGAVGTALAGKAARAVEDDAVRVRSALTAWSGEGTEPDFRTLLDKPGMYYKDGNISLAGGVNSDPARILLFRSPSGGYGRVLVWADLNTNLLYTSCFKGGQNSAWSDWERLARSAETAELAARCLMQRTTLTAQDDLDTLTAPGYYMKDVNVAVAHGADTAGSARILVIRSPSGGYSIAQLWFDTSTNRILYRTQKNSTAGFSAWAELQKAELCYRAEGKTEMGLLSYADGKGYLGNNTDLLYTRSEMLYEVEPGAAVELSFPELSAAAYPEVNVLFYLEDQSYGGASRAATNVPNGGRVTVPAGCRYLKIGTYRSGADAERSERFVLRSDRPITERPNLNLVNTTEAGTTTIGENDVPAAFVGQTFRTLAFTYSVKPGVRTSGRLLLPPNYDIHGDKVPLIVFVHGTNGMMSRTAQLGKIGSGSYIPYLQYLADEGYAVFDCYPWTYQADLLGTTSSPLLLRSHIDAYLSGIRYVCSRFNVDIDQVSLLCKSQGGYIGWWAMSQTEFPFRAVALFAPWGVLGGGGLFLGSSDTNNRNLRDATLKEITFSGTSEQKAAFIESGDIVNSGTAKEFAELDGNWQKLLNMASILCGVPEVENGTESGASAAAKTYAHDELYTKVAVGISVTPQWMLDEGLEAKPAGASSPRYIAQNKDLVKPSCCPSRFWVAMDDNAVSAYDVYAGYTWLRNGGGDTGFRQLPDSTGKHHAMDTDANALKVDSAYTTKQGVTYAANLIPLAYYEAAQWIGSKSRADLEPYATRDWVQRSIPSTASDVGAVAVAQGVAHAGEFVVVGSDGNITTVTMSTWQGGNY